MPANLARLAVGLILALALLHVGLWLKVGEIGGQVAQMQRTLEQ